ncbi:MAG TPA: hypothetical protein VLG46_09355 [Anaerolineae bacterium]|nr:hypothetical protein [Anaerolineae bacterium]
MTFTPRDSTQAKVLSNYSIPLSPTGAMYPIWGLWAYGNRWALEVAHVTLIRIPPNTIDGVEFGEVIQEGVALNQQKGYEESFGFQLLQGKPFYFFKRQGRLGISYDGQEIDLGYIRFFITAVAAPQSSTRKSQKRWWRFSHSVPRDGTMSKSAFLTNAPSAARLGR